MEGEAMADFDLRASRFVGPGGELPVSVDDEVTRKLAMLVEGEHRCVMACASSDDCSSALYDGCGASADDGTEICTDRRDAGQ